MWVTTVFTPNFHYSVGSSGFISDRHWKNSHARHKFDCLSRGGIAVFHPSIKSAAGEMRWDWD